MSVLTEMDSASYVSSAAKVLRLGLATTKDNVYDPRSWSGVPYSMFNALRRCHGVDVVALGPLKPPLRIPEGIRKVWYRAWGKRYLWEREWRILENYRKQFLQRIAAVRPDVVLTLGTIPAAALPAGTPYLIFTDATFQLNLDYYPTMTGVCRRSRRLGEEVDQHAFQQARMVVATSDWAARSIREHYGLPGHKVDVVAMGAQHVCDWAPATLEARIAARFEGPMRLLWIGVEWERKGGAIALDVARELYRRGVSVELNVVGVNATEEMTSLPYVRCLGFIDARMQRRQLEELFASSFAMLLPTRADNTPVAVADASSFALPSLAPDTGGMRAMLRDGLNGHVLGVHARGAEYADILYRYWRDPSAYLSLARSSRHLFETLLNTDHAAGRLVVFASRIAASNHAVTYSESRV